MKKFLFSAIAFCSFFTFTNAQSSAERVYTIFQTHCATAGCHNNASQAASLDLEGDGATLADKQQAVYNNIYKQDPVNATALSKDNYLVYPGDPYRSFLYRKMDNNLSADVHLDALEGAMEPQNASSITDLEIETVRQWILAGAKETGINFDFAVVEDYYTNGGIESVPNVPAPPEAGEGFQIHLGPFFIAPGEETEYLNKYETRLSETLEITKFKTDMGEFSHHFIVYNFVDYATGEPTPMNDVPVGYGLRGDIGFDNKGFVITEQYSNTLELPGGTAMEWKEDLVLDLNSHYINYSTNEVLKCEVYLNVYTQESGVAEQIMYSQLVPNTNIQIPNDGEVHSFNFNVPYAAAQFINPLFQDPLVHIWSMVSHTHAYGEDFNISINSDQVYDAGCANGMPGCAVEDFDYQHLPFRFYEPFLPFGTGDNLLANASYINNGPVDVQWGLTSQDEMMLFIIFFTLDTAGIDFGGPTSINTLSEEQSVSFYPNPTDNYANWTLTGLNEGLVTIEVFDLTGRLIAKSLEEVSADVQTISMNTSSWVNGMYVYKVQHQNQPVFSGKFAVK